MSNGYRVVIAAIGLAVISLVFGLGLYIASLNYPDEERHQSYRYAADKPVEIDTGSSVVGKTDTFEYRQPCKQPKGKDESDLCAQWRAAKAAENGALWAKWSFWIGVGGVITTVIGLYFLKGTLDATTEAVKETGKASNAMLRQNELTEHAQRPWVKISAELVNFELVERRAIIVDWSVKFENIGQMVAHNFQSLVKFIPMDEKFFTHMAAYMDDFPGDMEEIDAVLIPRDSSVYKGQSGNSIEHLPWETKDGFRKDCVLMLIAMARYRIPGNDTWRFSMQGFAIAENLENIDDRHFRYDFPDGLSIKDMHIRKLGRSRAT